MDTLLWRNPALCKQVRGRLADLPRTHFAEVAETEYAQALEVCVRKDLWVQIPPSAFVKCSAGRVG